MWNICICRLLINTFFHTTPCGKSYAEVARLTAWNRFISGTPTRAACLTSKGIKGTKMHDWWLVEIKSSGTLNHVRLQCAWLKLNLKSCKMCRQVTPEILLHLLWGGANTEIRSEYGVKLLALRLHNYAPHLHAITAFHACPTLCNATRRLRSI